MGRAELYISYIFTNKTVQVKLPEACIISRVTSVLLYPLTIPIIEPISYDNHVPDDRIVHN